MNHEARNQSSKKDDVCDAEVFAQNSWVLQMIVVPGHINFGVTPEVWQDDIPLTANILCINMQGTFQVIAVNIGLQPGGTVGDMATNHDPIQQSYMAALHLTGPHGEARQEQ